MSRMSRFTALAALCLAGSAVASIPAAHLEVGAHAPDARVSVAALGEESAGLAFAVADRVVFNARIFTSNPSKPWVSALAIKNGTVLWAGTDASALGFAGPSTVLEDKHGATLLPGAVDAHQHMLLPFNPATQLCFIPLFNSDGSIVVGPDGVPVLNPDPSWDEVRTAVTACAQQPGRQASVVLFAQRFYRTSKPFNVRVELSLASPAVPVIGFDATEGHGAVTNDAGFKAAGIFDPALNPGGVGVADPYGGYYGRTGNGTLDGWVQELAQVQLFKFLSDFHDDAFYAAQYKAWLDGAAALGVTSAYDIPFEYGPERAARVRALVSHPVDLTVACLPLADGGACPESLRSRSGWLTIKAFHAGAVKACGGWASYGYKDAAAQCPSAGTYWYGRPDIDAAQLSNFLRRVKGTPKTCGMVHVFGGSSTSVTVAAAEREGMAGQCLTLEHFDGASSTTRARARALGLWVVQNPEHQSLEADIASHYQPVEAADMLRFGTYVREGLKMALGGDEFGGTGGPFRRYALLMSGVRPGERMTAEEAVIAGTRNAALARQEASGMLVSGYPATYVEVDRNIFSGAVSDMADAKVVRTVIRGQQVYPAQ